MIQNINANNQISFLLSKKNSIDLEALNLLAGNTEQILSSCSYCEDNRKHRLDYNAWLPSNLYLNRETFLLEKFIQSCLNIFEVVEKYRLNLANIKIDSHYIFTEQEGFQFLYLPVLVKRKINKKKFVIKIFTQFKDWDFKVSGLLKHVKSLKTDDEVLNYLKECIEYTNMRPVPETEGETTILSQDVAEMESETTVLSQHTTAFFPNVLAECETTFLSDSSIHVEPKEIEEGEAYNLFLLRIGTGEQIHINKSQYSIGKDIKTMDYVLGNESVSRNHATVYIEENKFYLTDNGSTNGTTIEGIRVQSGERVDLSDGDIISLGNEVFQVLLERK